jgi:hypothetical protein
LIPKGLGGTKISANPFGVRGRVGVLRLDDKFAQNIGFQKGEDLATGIFAKEF